MKSIKTICIVLLLSINFSCEDNDGENAQNNEEQVLIEEQVLEIETLRSDFDQLRKNEELVRNFYQEFFGDLKIEEAGNKYLGDVYIQHNPNVADGREALISAALIWFAGKEPFTVDIRRVFASGDYVFIHTKGQGGKYGKGTSIMDVFRVENDKLVEHWDTIQDIPNEAENDHPFFRN